MSRGADEASVTIRYDKRTGRYDLTSSVNRALTYSGDTRHRVLSAFERDINRYIQWEKRLIAKRKEEEA